MSLKLKLVLCEKLLLSDNNFLGTSVNLLYSEQRLWKVT